MKDQPGTLVSMGEWYWDPLGADHHKSQTGFNADADYGRLQVYEYADTSIFNLKYNQSAAAFTGADGGLPAGDLNWWNGIVGVNDNNNNALPTKFTLEQNYPNPFNPSTKIIYNVPKESQVKLEIFNILGQQVATLVNEVKPSGKYTINFDASKLSSGVYVYQLTSQNQILSKKMMLLK